MSQQESLGNILGFDPQTGQRIEDRGSLIELPEPQRGFPRIDARTQSRFRRFLKAKNPSAIVIPEARKLFCRKSFGGGEGVTREQYVFTGETFKLQASVRFSRTDQGSYNVSSFEWNGEDPKDRVAIYIDPEFNDPFGHTFSVEAQIQNRKLYLTYEQWAQIQAGSFRVQSGLTFQGIAFNKDTLWEARTKKDLMRIGDATYELAMEGIGKREDEKVHIRRIVEDEVVDDILIPRWLDSFNHSITSADGSTVYSYSDGTVSDRKREIAGIIDKLVPPPLQRYPFGIPGAMDLDVWKRSSGLIELGIKWDRSSQKD